jgi:hypothetical protein
MFNDPPLVADELKPAYGRILARTPDPYLAALALVDGSIPHALWVSNNWRNDAVVIEYKKLELAEIDKENQISKSDLTKRVLAIIDSNEAEHRDKVAAARLIAEMNGYIEKPAAPIVNNQVNTAPTYRVVAMPESQSMDEWEKAAQKQQMDSLNVSTSRH